jgi:protein-tyrosine phosphatase
MTTLVRGTRFAGTLQYLEWISRSGAAMAASKHKTVLFLCTGNYYRSRFAEIVFNSAATRMGLPWRASSRGLALERGLHNVGPIAASVLETLKSMGIRHDEQTTRFPVSLAEAELTSVELVIALKHAEHLPLMQERFPAWSEKIEYWHVEDEPGVLPEIEREVNTLIARILGGGKAPPEPPPPPPTVAPAPKKQATLKVGRETKGRRGKGVTIVSEIPLDEAGVLDLAAKLKQKCGTGGTVKDGKIEIQGDQRDRLVSVLEALGYKVKRVGG